MFKKLVLSISFLFFLCHCAKLETNHSKVNKNIGPQVIYGKDDRLDLYQVLDINWRGLALSTVALVDKNHIHFNSDSNLYELDVIPYGTSNALCKNEAFYNQPTVSFCSGFLIGPEIIVTAGHCIRNQTNCENVKFVFGYNYAKEMDNLNKILESDVYSCREVIHTQANGLTGADYAVLRLDRPVTQYKPLPLQSQNIIDDKANLTVIGYPSGLPLKLAGGGIVRDNQFENYFVSNLDTYGGNSGSAVFNSNTRLVEGILVRGDTDFVYDQVNKCRRSNVCKDEACRGEDVVRIQLVLDHLTPSDLKPIN
jgi:V8-like Glu-specific endopeptidase